jgi:cytoskeletal protein RodZ
MSSIGTVLREARQAKSISFDEVYSTTKIHPRVLQRLENDTYSDLPSLFIKNFLKSYASFLEVDAQPLLDAYFQSDAGAAAQAHETIESSAAPTVGPTAAESPAEPAPFVWPEDRDSRQQLLTLRRLGIAASLPIALVLFFVYPAAKTLRAKPRSAAAGALRGAGVMPPLKETAKSERALPDGNATAKVTPPLQPTPEMPQAAEQIAAPAPAKAAPSARLRITCNAKVVYDGLLNGGPAKDAVNGWASATSSSLSPGLSKYALESLGKGAVTRVTIRLSGSCKRT